MDKPQIREIDAETALRWLHDISAPFPVKRGDKWYVLADEYRAFTFDGGSEHG